eukprot:10743719-Heterocapsa_arctica.AAC.1
MHGMHPHECDEPGIIAMIAPTSSSSASSPPSMLTHSLELYCEAMCGAMSSLKRWHSLTRS